MLTYEISELGWGGVVHSVPAFFGGVGARGSNGIGLNFDQIATFPDERLAVETENKT